MGKVPIDLTQFEGMLTAPRSHDPVKCDLHLGNIHDAKVRKARRVQSYLHHQEEPANGR